jgi:hypothetical protein
MRDIHTGVEALLQEPVCRGSVKTHLSKSCAAKVPLFERIGRGRYGLSGQG